MGQNTGSGIRESRVGAGLENAGHEGKAIWLTTTRIMGTGRYPRSSLRSQKRRSLISKRYTTVSKTIRNCSGPCWGKRACLLRSFPSPARLISDNGPQFVAKDFKEFIRLWQSSHVLCSPYYPQSNGKLERYHRTLKEQAIRPKTPLTLEDAKRVVGDFIQHYNQIRLHSAIGYIAPIDRLAGRHQAIFAARHKKLETAREARRIKRQQLTNQTN
jgi:transposase InsO family protein